jgi:microcystin-dependent protein
MSRVKTFDATGIPPGGRLFAGDMNSIQDHYADTANFAQTIDLAVLRVGDTAIQFVKFGTGEARLTAALRTDGIVRALGGLFAGAYTTAQRDAIPAGFRPFTLVIFNTTTNRFEWNAGTDAAPNWQPVANTNDAVPIGSTMDWPWAAGNVPSNYALPYGQALLKATYPLMDAIASAAGYPYGSTGTTFTMPDYRGRVGVGKDDMGGTAANRVTTAGSGVNGVGLGAIGGVENISLVTGQLPAHNHTLVAATITGAPALTGSPALSGSISNGSLAVVRTADVGLGDNGHTHAVQNWTQHAGGNNTDFGVSGTGDENFNTAYVNTSGHGGYISQQPTFGITGGVSNGSLGANIGTLASNAGTLDVGGTTDNAGSGTAHNNMQPSIVVNKIMRVA